MKLLGVERQALSLFYMTVYKPEQFNVSYTRFKFIYC